MLSILPILIGCAELGGDDSAGVRAGLPDGAAPDWGEGVASCPAAKLVGSLGFDHPLVGGKLDDDEFASAPFDLRYVYLAGEVPENGPCATCTDCSAEADWWGCWQNDDDPPGQYVASRIALAETAGAIPMFTYYVWYCASGQVEGDAEVAALSDGDTVARYLADWRFACSRVGQATSGPVILHVEPDLWGFIHKVSDDPDSVPAAVSVAAVSECEGLPDTATGFARCMLAIARAQAPGAIVGFHASAWGAGRDAMHEDDADFAIGTHAEATATFMRALGTGEADLVVVEMSDSDAGRDGRWWDPTNATRPNFNQALTWAGRLGASLDKPYLFWQVPFGHLALVDTCSRYRDNRVDYFFAYPGDFAATGMMGIAFGGSGACATTAATDGGNFIERAVQHFQAERPCLCGVCAE